MRTTSAPIRWLLRQSTPASSAAFVLVGVSGVLLFFHVAERQVENLHEWAGLALVLTAGLHASRHWGALVAYGRRGRALHVSLSLALLAAAGFVAVSLFGFERGGLDALRVRVERAPLSDLAPILHVTPAQLVARLQKSGFRGVSPAASAAQIAASSGRDGRAVLEALIVEPRPTRD